MSSGWGDYDVSEAAWLYARGWTQTEIAKRLQCDRSTVNRRISRAIEQGILELRFNWEQLSEKIRERLQEVYGCEDLRNEILCKLRQVLKKRDPIPPRNVLIVRAPDTSGDAEAQTRHLRSLAHTAALRVVRLWGENRKLTCGVGWGRTIRALVEAVAALNPTRQPELDFVPVCGEAVFSTATVPPELSATRLAGELKAVMTDPHAEQVTLTAVPCSVPAQLDAAQSKLVREFIELLPGYRQVFGRPGPDGQRQGGLIDELQMLVTSAGEGKESPWPWHAARADFEGVPWNSLVLGDVSGWAFPQPNLPPAEWQRVEEINRRWLGVRLADLQRCARRERDPGVILVVATPAKARITLEAILQGCVTELICDEPLAQALNQLLDDGVSQTAGRNPDTRKV